MPETATAAAHDKVAQIVAAAAAVMGRQGYAATSMKDIAQQAGVAQGLIHYYFDSKEALLLGVMHGMCGQMLEDCRTRFGASTGDPMARSWVALEAARDHCQQHPEVLRLLFEMVTVSLNNPAMRSELEAVYAEIETTTADMVRELNAQLPTPMPVPPEDFANVIIACIDGLALRAQVDSRFDLDAAYRAFGFLLLSSASSAYAVAGQPLPLESLAQAIVVTIPAPHPVQDDS
ncbi:MAG: TetR/AcrR family transcriptional regulator [Candidatus Dormibacteria bacterium]